MSYKKEMMGFNKIFAQNKDYEKFITTKYPNKKIAILSCIDTTLTELLPTALKLKNSDIKIIKNAGGVISSPVESVFAVYLLQFMNWK